MTLSRRLTMLSAVTVCAWSPSRAAVPSRLALYQATAIVTGTDMRQRPLGFALCLTEVLVKLTGAPKLAQDPAIAALASNADELVASFSYIDPRAGLLHHDDQGTYDRSYELTVRFDPAKVDAALAKLGLQVWSGSRPLLNPIILVRDREPSPFLLSSTAPRGAEMRSAILRFAAEVGMGVRFPTDADLAEGSVGLFGVPTPLFDGEPGLARVTGTLSWTVLAKGWVGSWWMLSGGVEHCWTITGVGYDEALGHMVRGAATLASGNDTP